ncbi:unnamed protein product [Paramecium sonneborni]|uniref:Uncharacterized protein n=1 Tax=Paramecium sonneborni TaxID=65129 RepID=A0A8S1NH53_9CILI|nr:unnamed protein product [Paramecium sonneborni]
MRNVYNHRQKKKRKKLSNQKIKLILEIYLSQVRDQNKQNGKQTIEKKNNIKKELLQKKLDKEIQQLDSDEQKQKDELKKIKKRFSSKSTMKLIYGKIQINSLENFILYLNQIKLLIINHSNQKMNEIDQVKCFK